ncbi:metalloproteinase inhibitor 1 [Crotalus adamanteus]|uniref:Metalloproteinase inhibitor 1 n=1 Tax=Crotalus adamanteus TaxID=8729 RepID=A0AAW1C034_CROAD
MFLGNLTEACRCVQVSLQKAYRTAKFVMRAKFMSVKPDPKSPSYSPKIIYTIQPIKVFKGPKELRKAQFLYSSASDDYCGYLHKGPLKGDDYVFSGSISDDRFKISMCSFAEPWDKVTSKQKEILKSATGSKEREISFSVSTVTLEHLKNVYKGIQERLLQKENITSVLSERLHAKQEMDTTKPYGFFLASFLIFMLLGDLTETCQCNRPSLRQACCEHNFVMRVLFLGVQRDPDSPPYLQMNKFSVRVIQVFKGSWRAANAQILYSPESVFDCGYIHDGPFQEDDYLISGREYQ